jgi:hypothetical protein
VSVIYIMKSKSLETDPLGTPCFTVPILRKISVMILFQLFIFCQTGSEPVGY